MCVGNSRYREVLFHGTGPVSRHSKQTVYGRMSLACTTAVQIIRWPRGLGVLGQDTKAADNGFPNSLIFHTALWSPNKAPETSTLTSKSSSYKLALPSLEGPNHRRGLRTSHLRLLLLPCNKPLSNAVWRKTTGDSPAPWEMCHPFQEFHIKKRGQYGGTEGLRATR